MQAPQEIDVSLLVEHLLSCSERLKLEKEISGSELAEILQKLAVLEVAEGGPYTSAPGVPADTDAGLNLAVAQFLALQDVRLPNLDAFLKEALTAQNLSSNFIPAPILKELACEYQNTCTPQEGSDVEGKEIVQLDQDEQRIMAAIREEAAKRFTPLPKHLADNATEMLEKTIKGNPDKQMSLMAHYVREALGKAGEQFSDTEMAQLGLANIFFWGAFIIYDDFWDEDEAAEPRLLPAANMFARHYIDFFSHLLPNDPSFRMFFHETMDALDAANTWEMQYCRLHKEGSTIYIPDSLPDYDDYAIKFYPAGGHVLGPVSLFVRLGYSVDSKEVERLITYFKHYLIAMQLNDDAHDWKEDLERGHISTAVAFLLGKWKQAHPNMKTIDLVDDMPALEQCFWFETLGPLCESVLAHAKKSEEALTSLAFLENPTPLRNYIVRNVRVAKEALSEKNKSETFLGAF